ncbi:hypothetical protein J4H86_02900 [Spiractinospora alimapuensis]|uniref:hypothetical protein n=1 Tax=Spiractinospora alimapuensis TaxID=2820884 RepID=UPI001F207A55|nr:hypothetical protein [Spiractinospora alimapuensis]QVQ52793.1 hypothetical protein J4H86_02900 [Spiractinospora alimapuensis]
MTTSGVGGITGNVDTAFGSAHTVNSGSGNQFNTYLLDRDAAVDYLRQIQVLPPTSGSVRRGRGVISVEEVRRITKCFVQPEGFPPTDGTRVGYFTGAAGVGKRTAAVAWLSRSADAVRPVRRLPDGATDDGEPPLHGTAIESGEFLLLDTTDIAADDFTALLHALPEYEGFVSRAEAWLAVIVTSEQERQLELSVRDGVAHIRPPEPFAVLDRHLRYQELPRATGKVDAETRHWVERLHTESIADLAHFTNRARNTNPTAGFTDWFATAVASMKDLDADITGLVETHVASADRATLLAGAVLEGLALEKVHAATMILLRHTDAPMEETPELERLGFTARLGKLGFTIGPERQVRFARVTYANAIRDRFWDDRQPLHPAFERWIKECVETLRLTGDEGLRLARRLTEQCLRVRRLDALLRIAHSWTTPSETVRPLEATQILTDALADPDAAQTVRRRLYAWAEQRETPLIRAQVITQICVTTLRESHPNQAFVRLRRLTRNADPLVRDHVQNEILRAADEDPRFRRTALQVLAARDMNPTDHELLFHLTHADGSSGIATFPAGHREGQAFRTCLEKAIAAAPDEAHRHGVRWLRACVTGDHWRTLTLVIDAALATGHGHVLYTTARRWALDERRTPHEYQRRRDVACAVIHRINRHDLCREGPR